MFEYHGWVNVLPGPSGRGEDDDAQAVGERVIERAGQLDHGTDPIDARWVNGYLLVHFGGVRNRRSEFAEQMLAFFRWIGQVAPGSYGLLHVRDDEDERDEEFQDQVRVLAMTRGAVVERTDPFLSPVVPTLEDEVDLDDI